MTTKKSISIVPETPATQTLPEGTTLFDVIAALQDAADDYFCEDSDAADLAVCASLVELRNRLSADCDADADDSMPLAA